MTDAAAVAATVAADDVAAISVASTVVDDVGTTADVGITAAVPLTVVATIAHAAVAATAYVAAVAPTLC